MLDWNDLKYVLETAEQGGISGAARVLGVNHATVARRISAAEEALGARLFERLPSGYVPTEAGLDAVNTARQMARMQFDLDRQIGARDTELSGVLRVTASELLCERILSPIFAGFIEAHPEIDLRLVATNDPLNMAQREADVAIRFSQKPPEALVGRCVISPKGSVYASRALMADDKGGEAPLDWIRFAHWPGPPPEVKAVRPYLRVRMTVDDMISAIGAVRAGIGATRMGCFLGDADPEMMRVPGMPLFDYLPLWVLTHADLKHVPRIRAFTDYVTAGLLAQKDLFEGRCVSEEETASGGQ